MSGPSTLEANISEPGHFSEKRFRETLCAWVLCVYPECFSSISPKTCGGVSILVGRYPYQQKEIKTLNSWGFFASAPQHSIHYSIHFSTSILKYAVKWAAFVRLHVELSGNMRKTAILAILGLFFTFAGSVLKNY